MRCRLSRRRAANQADNQANQAEQRKHQAGAGEHDEEHGDKQDAERDTRNCIPLVVCVAGLLDCRNRSALRAPL